MPTAVISVTAGQTKEIVAAPSEALAKIRVLNYVTVFAASGSYQWKSATTAKSGVMGPFAAGAGNNAQGGGRTAVIECAAGEALNIVATDGGVYGHLQYEIY